MSQNGVELISEERRRQVDQEGWTAAHDDTHAKGELARAAAMYATPSRRRDFKLWPWSLSWWKPTPDNRVRELAKAGALIAAEIDRLLRKAEKGGAR